jgi:protein Mpv17
LWLGASVVLDQVLAAPLVLGMFMSVRGVVDGRSTEQIKQSFKKDFWSTYKAGWALWTPTQLVNFYFIPLQHRLVRNSLLERFYVVRSIHDFSA